VWVCAKVIILKGVSIGDYSIVGAGSVVTKDIENNSLVVGNPARKIGDTKTGYS
jgi:maltose O-acetyltransferase